MALPPARSGDNSPFDDDVLAQIETVRRIGYRLLRDRQDLDDFTQEVALRVYAHRRELRDDRCLAGYVRSIARNTAIKWNRKRQPVPMDVLPDVPLNAPSASEQVEAEERRRLLADALATLEPTDESLLRAVYFAESNTAELERRYAVSKKTLSVRLSRARQRLRGVVVAFLSVAWGFLFPVRRARGFGELSGRMTAMRPAMVLTACLVVAGGVGVGRLVSAEMEPPPVVMEEALEPVELVTAGGGVAPKPSPLMAQAPAAPMLALLEGTWTKKADMPETRSFHVACTVDNRIYVLGGEAGDGSRSIKEYDPTTEKWTKKNDLHTPRSRFQACASNGKIYMIAGLSVNSLVRWTEEYDPIADTWTRRSDSLALHEDGTTDAVNGKVYVVGGWNGVSASTFVEEYDPVTDKWTQKADIPTPRWFAASGAVNGKLYVIGGWTGKMYTATMEMYDPATDRWTKKADMPTTRMNFAVSVVNGRIYAIGGAANGRSISAVEEYDPETDRWTPLPDIPTARWALESGAVNGKVYALGGNIEGGNWGIPVATVEEFDLGSLSVSPTGKLPSRWGEWKAN